MFQILAGLLSGLAGSLLARVLTGAGLAVVTFSAVSVGVDFLETEVIAAMGQLPASAAAIMGLFGVGEALGIILGAVALRATLAAATAAVGVKS